MALDEKGHESRIKTHIIPLLGKRVVTQLSIADVEQMQSDVKNGKTAKARTGGRGGKATGGAGVASRCLGTIQAIIGHAKLKGLLANHPTQGAKKLASKKRSRVTFDQPTQVMPSGIVSAIPLLKINLQGVY